MLRRGNLAGERRGRRGRHQVRGQQRSSALSLSSSSSLIILRPSNPDLGHLSIPITHRSPIETLGVATPSAFLYLAPYFHERD